MIDSTEIIRNAKKLIDENDYAEAFKLLSSINSDDLKTPQKIVAYLMLTKCYINSNNLENVLQYCNIVFSLSKQIKSSFLSQEFISIGNVFIRENRPDQAKYLYFLAKEMTPPEDGHKPYVIYFILSLINSFIDLKKINDAIMVTGEFKDYKNTTFDESLSKFSREIALRFYALKHYRSAALLLSIAMSAADPQNNALYTSICTYQAIAYLQLDIRKAIKFSKMALKKDSAFTTSSFIAQFFINTADNLSINNSEDAIMLYLHAEKLTSDEKLLTHILMKLCFIYKENKDEKLLVHIFMLLSFISKKNKDIFNAIKYSETALFLLEKNNFKNQKDYKNISLIYSTLKNLYPADSFLYFLFNIGEKIFNKSPNNNLSLINSLQNITRLIISNINKNEYQSLKMLLTQIMKFILSAYEGKYELNMTLKIKLGKRSNLDLLKDIVQQLESCDTKADNLSRIEPCMQNENRLQARMPATKKRKLGEHKNTHWNENREDLNINNTTLPYCDPTQQTFGSKENRFTPSL